MKLCIYFDGGIILKKSTSLLFSGLLVSGMVLGAVTNPVTVHADSDTATQTQVTNNVSYYDQSGKFILSKTLQGKQGTDITYAPDGYALTGDKPVFGADQANVKVTVAKMISVKVNYVDQNGKLVNSEVVNGGAGNTYKLTDIPAGCSWVNDEEQTITLVEGKEYNVPVNKKVFNTIIFKTSDNTEVGRTEIFGDKVGDSISLTSDKIPTGYTTDTSALTLQTDNNTQFVTVTKSADTSTGVVTVKDKAAQLYSIYGNTITGRTLDPGTPWKTFGTKVINGETYYQVSTYEWVKASDVDVKSDAAITPFVSTVKTGSSPVNLVDKTGKVITGRGLGANSEWKTANKIELNGKTYYQVATNEWVDASLVTVQGQNVDNNNTTATPFVSVVTTTNSPATLYTKDGQAISGRGLGPNSEWKTANKIVLNGETYYQVATNEWVKASSLIK